MFVCAIKGVVLNIAYSKKVKRMGKGWCNYLINILSSLFPQMKYLIEMRGEG